MVDPEIRRVVERIKTKEARAAAGEERRHEELRHRLFAEEEERVAKLKRDIESWHKLMVTAGYPETKIGIREIEHVKQGLFGSHTEVERHEVPAWTIAEVTLPHRTSDYIDVYRLNLAYDRRLTETRFVHHVHPDKAVGRDGFAGDYAIGAHFKLIPHYGGAELGGTQEHPYELLESQIPGNLLAIAQKAEIDWQPESPIK